MSPELDQLRRSLFEYCRPRGARDHLFVGLALGFGTLALHWAGLAVLHPPNETRHYLFVVRLLAFVFILAGVIVKNASPRTHEGGRR